MHSLCIAVCIHSVFALPDFTKSFRIENDPSDTAVGGVLTQDHASIHKPIDFCSKTLIDVLSGAFWHMLLFIVT